MVFLTLAAAVIFTSYCVKKMPRRGKPLGRQFTVKFWAGCKKFENKILTSLGKSRNQLYYVYV